MNRRVSNALGRFPAPVAARRLLHGSSTFGNLHVTQDWWDAMRLGLLKTAQCLFVLTHPFVAGTHVKTTNTQIR